MANWLAKRDFSSFDFHFCVCLNEYELGKLVVFLLSSKTYTQGWKGYYMRAKFKLELIIEFSIRKIIDTFIFRLFR